MKENIVAKNLLLNYTCNDCIYLSIGLNKNCRYHKYKPDVGICDKFDNLKYIKLSNTTNEVIYFYLDGFYKKIKPHKSIIINEKSHNSLCNCYSLIEQIKNDNIIISYKNEIFCWEIFYMHFIKKKFNKFMGNIK